MNSAGQGYPGDPYGYEPDTVEYAYPTYAKKETIALKPCPFCGKKPTTIKNCYNGVIIGLRCWSCSLDMVDEDCVTKWNRRVDE